MMKNNIDDADLVDKIKKMDYNELVAFLASLRIVAFFCTVAGVSSIVLSLFVPDLIVYIITAVTLSVMGNMAVTTDTVIEFVKHNIKLKLKTDK